ncbi:hypothetical protein ACMFMG_008764 [Clarireedia jacksonii]
MMLKQGVVLKRRLWACKTILWGKLGLGTSTEESQNPRKKRLARKMTVHMRKTDEIDPCHLVIGDHAEVQLMQKEEKGRIVRDFLVHYATKGFEELGIVYAPHGQYKQFFEAFYVYGRRNFRAASQHTEGLVSTESRNPGSNKPQRSRRKAELPDKTSPKVARNKDGHYSLPKRQRLDDHELPTTSPQEKVIGDINQVDDERLGQKSIYGYFPHSSLPLQTNDVYGYFPHSSLPLQTNNIYAYSSLPLQTDDVASWRPSLERPPNKLFLESQKNIMGVDVILTVLSLTPMTSQRSWFRNEISKL